jgi:AraC-like DNA-binding protein/beta-xylosidase
MLQHYVENRDYVDSYGYLADCYAVLEYLSAHFMLRASDLQRNEDTDRYEERLRQINHYIYNNYDQPISMKELSEKLYLSNGYLSRFFKKNYGMSFAGYLTNVRVFHAADDLIYTDEPITRIAYNNGFTSAALFNKVFKKSYGQTPSEFRRQKAKKAEKDDRLHQEELEKRLEKMLETDDLAGDGELQTKKEVSGEYTVQFYDDLKNCWGNTINFGDASNLLHSSMREHLTQLHDALGFQYVRFWGLFVEDFFIRPEQEHYNFSQIDSVLDFILELGMKPHIELGIKPRMIHYKPGEADVRSQVTMSDYSIQEWERLMKAFMRHLSHHYGQDILDDWRMELWFDESWRQEESSEEKYLRFFQAAYTAVKSCNEKIQLGGYGIRMDAGFDRRLAFLKKWNRSECRPDFLSVMFYAYERREDGIDRYAKRNTDDKALLHSLVKEKALIADSGMWDLPLIVSEWNLTPSVRNFINDTTFKAAYIIKNTIDMYGKVDIAAYCAGSDRQHSSFDTPDILFGGTGLLTRDAVMKPAAFAYDFLKRLYP